MADMAATAMAILYTAMDMVTAIPTTDSATMVEAEIKRIRML